MSILERHVVQCDHEFNPDELCGEEFDDSDGDGPGAVVFAALQAGWLVVGNRHYCPSHKDVAQKGSGS